MRIGLEVHCQLTSLNTKLFCPCSSEYRNLEPNSNICPVCAGLPGSLPRPNRRAIEKAALLSMALGCTVPPRLAFFRKNYFYPDLPKNFQITQLDAYGPTSVGGTGSIDSGGKTIRIRRIQLEEDPGRIIYEGAPPNQNTLIDYNRAGVALVEIVTEPDFEEPKQARQFLNMLAGIIENLGVADPSLEGAMRADGNISSEGPKVELKNIGSFHDLERALRFEAARQETLLSKGHTIDSETRHWDEKRKTTISARKKEQDMDYRYFLEGDIPWIALESDYLERLRIKMPESITSRRKSYADLGISPQVADVLSSEKFFSDLFARAHTADTAKEVANLITTDLMGLVDTREKREKSKITAAHLRILATSISEKKMTRASARAALQEAASSGRLPSNDAAGAIGGGDLEDIILFVLAENEDAAKQAATNPDVINYLVGLVMKKTAGRADPAETLALLRKRIAS